MKIKKSRLVFLSILLVMVFFLAACEFNMEKELLGKWQTLGMEETIITFYDNEQFDMEVYDNYSNQHKYLSNGTYSVDHTQSEIILTLDDGDTYGKISYYVANSELFMSFNGSNLIKTK